MERDIIGQCGPESGRMRVVETEELLGFARSPTQVPLLELRVSVCPCQVSRSLATTEEVNSHVASDSDRPGDRVKSELITTIWKSECTFHTTEYASTQIYTILRYLLT